ncbi:MAG TPA: SMI1/KNR4 family protein [Thermosynechococcaceae cyanobacterium]
MSYIEKSKSLLAEINQVFGYPNDVSPCSLEEIKILEQDLETVLPEAYREFLLWTGKGTHYLDFDHITLDSLRTNREDAIEIMRDDGCMDSLPSRSIVFYIHHGGCQFAFICASEGSNPPVHYYSMLNGITWNYTSNIDEFFASLMSRSIQAYQKF